MVKKKEIKRERGREKITCVVFFLTQFLAGAQNLISEHIYTREAYDRVDPQYLKKSVILGLLDGMTALLRIKTSICTIEKKL